MGLMPSTQPKLGLAARPTSTLWRAKQDGRTIVTADLDFPRLLALAQATEPSLVLFREGNWSDADVIARMEEILHALPEAELAQSIIVVDRDRVRRRRLPIGSHEHLPPK
jgi:predicted nuclease of predicted toxin-antitoxin system